MGDVFVIVEQRDGVVAPVSFEVLGAGAALASSLGTRCVAVVAGGDDAASLAPQLGAAAQVVSIADGRLASYSPEAYKAAIGEVLAGRDARLVLLGNTTVGIDLGAGLSAALGVPLVAYATDLSAEGATVVATSRLYGGKADVDIAIDGAAVVTVQAGAFPADAGRVSGSPELEEVKAPAALEGVRTRFLELIEPQGGDVDITRQDILVSVGRGIQNADNLEVVQELADALGGALSASRPVTDNGWLPKTRQVGKSGLAVKPKLYLCAGISGAPEHLEGMRDAELIIAINTDEKAPIFDVAHYGITADLFDVVPALTEKLKG
ncbi:MAG: electron transfer flavoprotein subunit alpha/FixB family protein [Actinomycetota bacterium]